ncbi:MAG: nucleotidyl transferase AbiEii/AbiGii toxin family protein [Chloroflexota bacterium]|nr:nucleotidyl transferase AbiEii/AbiGii toxin family protein [Chloroflexota bacterium]
MKPYLKTLIEGTASPLQGRNLTREYLQARILGTLQQAGAMVPLAFHGGTALRFLYAIPRYSEDLDFALERASADYDFRGYLRTIQRELTAENYELSIKLNDRKVVHSAFLRFPGLLYELGLSPHRSEVLAVKVEVDTRPPEGAALTTTVIRRYVMLHLQHHDRATLLAGKLHALLQRNYVKGRDLYDLAWYLSDPDWPPPNLILLNNALQQTGWVGEHLTAANWRAVVREYVAGLDWTQVVADVRPFLARRADLELLTRETLLKFLDKKQP